MATFAYADEAAKIVVMHGDDGASVFVPADSPRLVEMMQAEEAASGTVPKIEAFQLVEPDPQDVPLTPRQQMHLLKAAVELSGGDFDAVLAEAEQN